MWMRVYCRNFLEDYPALLDPRSDEVNECEMKKQNLKTQLELARSFVDQPYGSNLTAGDIHGQYNPLASFTPDMKGRYEVQCLVSDGCNGASKTAVVWFRCPASGEVHQNSLPPPPPIPRTGCPRPPLGARQHLGHRERLRVARAHARRTHTYTACNAPHMAPRPCTR